MAEPPAETLRRGATELRVRAEAFIAHERLRTSYKAIANLLDVIAEDMAAAEAFVCGVSGAVTSEEDGYRADWTIALKIAYQWVPELEAGRG